MSGEALDLNELPEMFPVEVATPWHHKYRSESVNPEFPDDGLEWTYICDDRGMVLFDVPRLHESARAKHRHCIEHMIRAVNAHDDLVAALEGARDELQGVLRSINRKQVYFDGDEFHERLAKIEAALTKAGAT